MNGRHGSADDDRSRAMIVFRHLSWVSIIFLQLLCLAIHSREFLRQLGIGCCWMYFLCSSQSQGLVKLDGSLFFKLTGMMVVFQFYDVSMVMKKCLQVVIFVGMKTLIVHVKVI